MSEKFIVSAEGGGGPVPIGDVLKELMKKLGKPGGEGK